MHLDLRDDGSSRVFSQRRLSPFIQRVCLTHTQVGLVDRGEKFCRDESNWTTYWATSTKPRHKEKLQQCRHHSRDRAATGGSFVRVPRYWKSALHRKETAISDEGVFCHGATNTTHARASGLGQPGKWSSLYHENMDTPGAVAPRRSTRTYSITRTARSAIAMSS